MPIYEYACGKCNHQFDALQKMDAEPLKICPECGEPTLKKLLSAPNFRLKGAGWYETDFKKDNQRNLADDGKKKTSKDKEGQSGKADKSDKSDKKAADGKKAAGDQKDSGAKKSA